MNLTELTIKQLIEGYKNKSFSVTEVVKAYLERTHKINPELNVFITVLEKEAKEQAQKADRIISNEGIRANSLLGIPIALKDLYLTKGIRTTAGSKVLDNYIPQYDATTVKKLKDAGAIIIGKTNCDAWAHGSSGENSDYGPTLNPWNKEYVPGGSSSGSAVSVAAGLSAASTGTDTGGSIRQPASFCNVVGLKPTYGRVSRYGIVAMASSFDSIGHFTKTVEDNAIFLNVTSGQDEMDATTSPVEAPDYTSSLKKGVKGIKIGLPKEYFIKGAAPEIKDAVKKAIKILEEKGAQIVEVSLPHTEYAMATYYIIQPAEVSSNLARYDGIRFGSARQSFEDEAKRRIMLGTFTLSAGYYEAYYKKAMQVRTLIKKDFEDAFSKVDAIIAPVSPTLPWKFGEKVDDPLKMYLSDVFTVTANLAGIPGLSVPCGFVNGFPVGFQILGPQFSEELLYQVGYAYEQETRWYLSKPSLNF